LDAVPRKSTNIVSRSIAGECLLVPVTKRTADMSYLFTLSVVAAFIWELIDGGTSLRTILEKVLAEYDVDPAEAEADLVAFVQQLHELDAVELA
jgi:hypothetical protein